MESHNRLFDPSRKIAGARQSKEATMSIFEIGMLLCFGSAWPFSIYKSYRHRHNGSKSIGFLLIIFSGYVLGIMHKLVFNFDVVICIYILNCSMVFVDMLLYLRNHRGKDACLNQRNVPAGLQKKIYA
jgi:hypothetical protein